VQDGIAELLRLEPRIGELEREIDGVRDDGSAPWFCSNFVWLPVNTRLRQVVGVARLPQPGDEAHPELYHSRTYERAFEHLSRRLPPCRACGCVKFEELARASGSRE